MKFDMDYDADLRADLANESIARDEWRRRWPKACPACRGWGAGAPTYESHGFRFGPKETVPGDPCEALPEDTCHRCGHSGPGDEGEPALGSLTNPPCPACGWDYDDGEPA